MKYIFLILLMALSTNTFAADVQLDDGPNGLVPLPGLVEDLKTSLNEVALLDAKMDVLVDDNERLLKEYKVLSENNKEVLNAFEQKRSAFVNTELLPYQKQKQSQMDAIAEDYNSNCAEDRVGKLPQHQYDKCQIWQRQAGAQIIQIKQEGDKHLKTIADAFDAREVASTNDILVRQRARIQQINDTMKANFATWENVQASNKKMRKHVEMLEGMIRNKCTNPTPQTLKWCNSVQWDGASKKLKPLPGG